MPVVASRPIGPRGTEFGIEHLGTRINSRLVGDGQRTGGGGRGRAVSGRSGRRPGPAGAVRCGQPLTEAEKLLTARPTPPFHGSNPAWMLVRYQDDVMAPRLRTSLMKSSTLNDHDVIGDGAT